MVRLLGHRRYHGNHFVPHWLGFRPHVSFQIWTWYDHLVLSYCNFQLFKWRHLYLWQKLSYVKLAIFPDHLRQHSPLKFCMRGRVLGVVIYFKLNVNRMRGLGDVGRGSKIAISHWQEPWLIQQLVLPYSVMDTTRHTNIYRGRFTGFCSPNSWLCHAQQGWQDFFQFRHLNSKHARPMSHAGLHAWHS